MNLSIFLDFTIIVLLATTIAYAVILNRRLSVFRKSQSEFSGLIESFNQSASTTEALLAQVKAVAIAGDGNLNRQQFNRQIQKGQDLAADLKFLLQRGDEMADRLTGEAETSGHGRQPAAAGIVDTGIVDTGNALRNAAGAANGGTDVGRSRAENELFQALKAVR
jgi:hypothetical protein